MTDGQNEVYSYADLGNLRTPLSDAVREKSVLDAQIDAYLQKSGWKKTITTYGHRDVWQRPVTYESKRFLLQLGRDDAIIEQLKLDEIIEREKREREESERIRADESSD